jgi:hypothetical protein
MRRITRTSCAELDLVAIGLELSQYGERAVERALELIEGRCEVIREFPYGGEACLQFGA